MRGLRGLSAAMMIAAISGAGSAGSAGGAPTVPADGVSVPQRADTAPTQSAPSTGAMRVNASQFIRTGFMGIPARGGSIWRGTAKRGSRRGRSRWSYGR